MNYKFTLRTGEALADHDYCTNKLFDKVTININLENIDIPLHIKISSHLNSNATTIKIDLSFLEAPQPNCNNHVNVQ